MIPQTPGAFFSWCLRNADSELTPFRKNYPKYAALNGSGDYLWRQYDRRTSDLQELVHPGIRALEIGCGLSADSHWMALRGASVLAIDANSRWISGAKALSDIVRSRFSAPLDIEIRKENVFNVTGSFDLIYMKEALHHIEPRSEIAGKLASLLAPGGSVVVLEPNAINPIIQAAMIKRRGGFNTVICKRDPITNERFIYGNERILLPSSIRKLFSTAGIEGRTRLFRILPTALSNVRPLTAIASWLESKAERIMAPLCIHCVYRGNKPT
jgi:2-polyprenyl-3-methyl-5-hydroxy-6-metoxy-1,4-benzoquinol methylase